MSVKRKLEESVQDNNAPKRSDSQMTVFCQINSRKPEQMMFALQMSDEYDISSKNNQMTAERQSENSAQLSLAVKRRLVQHDHDYYNQTLDLRCPKLMIIADFASKTIITTESASSETPVPFTSSSSSSLWSPLSRQDRRLLRRGTLLDNDGFDVYRDDIFCYKMRIEETHLPLKCLRNQTQINEFLRVILVKWLTDIHHKLHLCQETLFTAVNIIDRFLSLMDVVPESLQMLGLTSLLIASKYEEIFPPNIEELLSQVEVEKNHRTLMKKLECIILKAMSFNLSHPTALYFLEYYAAICIKKADLVDTENLKKALAFCRLVLELSLQDYQLCQIKPSLLSLCVWLLYISQTDDPETIYGFVIPKGYYSLAVFNDCFCKVRQVVSNLRNRYPNLDSLSQRYRILND